MVCGIEEVDMTTGPRPVRLCGIVAVVALMSSVLLAQTSRFDLLITRSAGGGRLRQPVVSR